jgi:hypothetical protein
LSENEKYLHSAKICGDGILQAMGSSDWLPGELDDEWCGTVKWVCLTGNSQIAHCLLLLYQALGDERYLEAGKRLNAFVRRTIDIAGPEETRGAVKGSFPVSGSYGAYEYLNWAVKFTVDSNMLERSILA